jgi:hypothetical protein
MVAATGIQVKHPRWDSGATPAGDAGVPSGDASILFLCGGCVILVLGACGDDGAAVTRNAPDTDRPTSAAGPDRPRPGHRVARRGRDGWLLCPGSVAPCWPVVEPGDPDLADRSRRRDRHVGSRHDLDRRRSSWARGGPSSRTRAPTTIWGGRRAGTGCPVRGVRDAPTSPAIWLTADDVLVMVVNDDDTASAPSSPRGGRGGLCRRPRLRAHAGRAESAARRAGRRWSRWGERGWVVLSGSLDVTANRVVIAFDEIDQRAARRDRVHLGRPRRDPRPTSRCSTARSTSWTSPPTRRSRSPPSPAGPAGWTPSGSSPPLRRRARMPVVRGRRRGRVKPIWPHGTGRCPDPSGCSTGEATSWRWPTRSSSWRRVRSGAARLRRPHRLRRRPSVGDQPPDPSVERSLRLP